MKKDFKTSDLKIPENYFDDFEAQLFARIEAEKFPKSTGFSVPEDYFSKFDDTITLNEKTKVIPLFPKKYSAYAAAIAAILIVGAMIFNTSQETASLDSIQISLIDKYIDEGNLNMDLYDLTTYLEPEDFPNIDIGSRYFTETTLENYLLENTDEELLLDD